MSTSRAANIAVLDADIPVPAVRSVRGTYTDIFANLLHQAQGRLEKQPHVSQAFQRYDVVLGEYPTDLADVDGIIITGSAASAYDDQAWIRTLNDFIKHVYHNHPRIRFFGSCFGHQIICQALLAPYGVHVTKDPMGWETGVHFVTLTSSFKKAVRASETGVPSKLRFQFIHSDHVVIPDDSSLPSDWQVMGSSEHCTVQGIIQPGRILTFQGHFEFDRFINSETFKVFTTSWNQDAIDKGLVMIDADDDATIAAEIVARFFLEDDQVSQTGKTGLLTPPEDEATSHGERMPAEL